MNLVGPVYSRKLVLRLPPDLKSFAGEFDRSPHQFARAGADFSIHGVARNGAWFISLGLENRPTASYYHMLPFIKERFPSLAELARTWTFDRVLSEYQKSTTEERILTLVAELAGRSMSDSQFVEFLSKARRPEVYEGYGPKMQGVIQAFEMAHKEDSLPPTWMRRRNTSGRWVRTATRRCYLGWATPVSGELPVTGPRPRGS